MRRETVSQRTSRRTPILLLAAALLPVLSQPSGASDSGASVTVEVETSRMLFQDELYRARFSATGACIDPSDDVEVTHSVCEGPVASTITDGTVRSARLGFNVIRRSEAGSRDLPLLETTQAAAEEQLEAVHVEVLQPGDLTVVITGRPAAEVDPEPVAGSQSSDGEISGRSVTWHRQALGRGTYDFSARFRPQAVSGFLGTFVPEVRVELKRSSSRLLEYPLGSVPAEGSAELLSRLLMTQRVAPPSGPPSMTVTGYRPIMGSGTLPNTWETSGAMDGRGAWVASAQGQVSASNRGPLADLAPDALGVADAAFMSMYGFFPHQPKAIPWPNFEFLPDFKPAGFQLSVQTASTSTIDLMDASTIWDRDTMEFGYVTGIHTLAAGSSTGLPDDSNGVIRPDWDGGVARTWSGTWVNFAPAGEPNSLNPNAYDPRKLAGVVHQHTATIPMVVSGGDVDNRSGGNNLKGTPASVSVPSSECPYVVIRIDLWVTPSNYSTELSSLAGCPSIVRVTPQVGPGGYWLESSRNDYDRRWSNLTALQVFTVDEPRYLEESNDELVVAESVLVPRGASATVTSVDAVSGVTGRVPLSPGVWRVTFRSSDGISTRLIR